MADPNPVDFMPSGSSTAALIEHWRRLRNDQTRVAVGSSTDLSGVAAVSFVGEVVATTDDVHADIDQAPSPPEVMVGFALVEPMRQTDEGMLIAMVTPAWMGILKELESDPNALTRLDWRQTEELVDRTH